MFEVAVMAFFAVSLQEEFACGGASRLVAPSFPSFVRGVECLDGFYCGPDMVHMIYTHIGPTN